MNFFNENVYIEVISIDHAKDSLVWFLYFFEMIETISLTKTVSMITHGFYNV